MIITLNGQYKYLQSLYQCFQLRIINIIQNMQERPIRRRQQNQLRPLTTEQIDAAKQILVIKNNEVTQKVNDSHSQTNQLLVAVAAASMGYFFYKMSQVEVIVDENDVGIQHQNTAKQQRELTTNQLLMLTLAVFSILYLIKSHFEHQERDHKGSPFMEQIDESEFERQAQKKEEFEQELQRGPEWKKYQRDKRRFERVEARLPPLVHNIDDTLRNLQGDSDNYGSSLERQLLAVDERVDTIKRIIEGSDAQDNFSVSNMSVQSQNARQTPRFPGNSSQLERQSMDPPGPKMVKQTSNITLKNSFPTRVMSQQDKS